MTKIKNEEQKVNTPDAKETKTLPGQKDNNMLPKAPKFEIVSIPENHNEIDIFRPYKGGDYIIASSE